MTSISPLPLNDAWPSIFEALQSHRNLVLVAEPGAGKTTRFPPLLLKSGLIESSRSIVMLEPRRLAARAAASRIAFEESWSVGSEIGYQVRFENRIGPQTKIEVLTEGLLTRRLQNDSELKKVGAVILDEFHERSIHTDIAIGLLLELQELSRPDLRIIVMSATLDAEKVASFLGNAPIVRVPGRHYDVSVTNQPKPLSLKTDLGFVEDTAELVLDIASGRKKRAGDVLVFLPGAREIRDVGAAVQAKLPSDFVCVPLHGGLTLSEQDTAIRPAPSGKSKIVLATNIAESSLTIDGVGTVVDTGLARIVRSDSAGFARLQLSRISMASATQRAGRAGRQFAGYCYRQWSKIDEASMPDFEQPEILRADLTETLLFLFNQGIGPETFTWFESPQPQAVREAITTLEDLGFLKDGGITANGREAVKLPLPVRPARLLLEAQRSGHGKLGAELAALLTERDLLQRSTQNKNFSESDVLLRLRALRGREGDPATRESILRVARQLEDVVGRIGIPAKKSGFLSGDEDDVVLKLVMLSHPDRICRRRRSGESSALMVGGKGVQLHPSSSVAHSEFFVAISSMEGRQTNLRSDPTIAIASRIDREWLEECFGRSIGKFDRTAYNRETESVISETFLAYRDLPLEEPRQKKLDTDAAFSVLLQACLDDWDRLSARIPDIDALRQRLDFLRSELGDDVPTIDEATIRATLEELCFGATRMSEIEARDPYGAFLRHLPVSTVSLLKKEAPERLKVPSGSEIRVHYPNGRAPYIEVRIQEVFGWIESPKLARGRVNLQLHLLGPNFRPVQVTSDLASFWKSGYAEVRKELRARYPKHSWPEDPLTAKAEAKGRPRS